MTNFSGKIDPLRLEEIYKDTERAGSKVNSFDLKIIATRFFFLSSHVDNKYVVEFGAGSILGKSEMLSKCMGYTAIEIHPDTAIELRNALGDKYTILNEDCCETSLPDNCCDTIIAFAMIYYNDFEDLITEAARLLKPDGKIIFCSPNYNQPNFKPAPGSIEYLQPNEVEEICGRHGIIIKTFGAYQYKIPRKNTIVLLKRFFRAYLNNILGGLKELSPKIYLYLRAMRFGKVKEISNDVCLIDDFEIPVKYNLTETRHFRMYYYEGTKL